MSETIRFSLFQTAIGHCAIAWSPRGIVAVRLPEADEDRMKAQLVRRTGAREAEPPPEIRAAVAQIARLLDGGNADLASLVLDMSELPAFDREVYDLTRAIPRGATRTYGALAADLGDPQLARDVGQALGRNPIPIIVPCHRVVGAGEKLVGFSAPGGIETKRRLLAIEGVWPGGGPSLFDHFGVTDGPT